MSKHQVSLSFLLLACLTCGALPAGEPKEVVLVGKDLAAWRAPTGEWMIVGEAGMDTADRKRLVTKPGAGVMVNGPNGRTSNLLSRIEHGDVEAHVEFMVPAGLQLGRLLPGPLRGADTRQLGRREAGLRRLRRGSTPDTTPKSAPPSTATRRASTPAGRPARWQTFDVIFRAPRFNAQGEKVANAPIREDRAQRDRGPPRRRVDRLHPVGHLQRREAAGPADAPGRPRPGRVSEHPAAAALGRLGLASEPRGSSPRLARAGMNPAARLAVCPGPLRRDST